MIVYLLKRYFFIAILFALLLAGMFSLAGTHAPITKALVWSGIVSLFATHWFFQRQNLWILYHNLRLPKMPLLGLCLFLFETAAIVVGTVLF